ncbi:hypothetical protein VP424E501_P0036 [Vibrio phage 424E50-1]|nr:hypothetical protein VP424E501_P0036 [Vibrio phage 424E50-1]
MKVILLFLGILVTGIYLVSDKSYQEPVNPTPVATHSESEVVSPITEVQCLRPNGEVKEYLVKHVVGLARYGNVRKLSHQNVSVTFDTMESFRYTVAIDRCEFRWL